VRPDEFGIAQKWFMFSQSVLNIEDPFCKKNISYYTENKNIAQWRATDERLL
jgi:hypothetical protein